MTDPEPLHLLPDVLLRAPLLAAGRSRVADLLGHRLGPVAVALASPDLARALGRGERPAALARYARRAAFRPTPSGLLAGVAVGRLGAATRIRLGAPRAHFALSAPRAASLARALLDDADIRAGVHLRLSPSFLGYGGRVQWLQPGAGDLGKAALDEITGRLAQHLADWTAFPEAAALLPDGDEGYLLALRDRGLLVDDLTPAPLGPPPADALLARLREIPAAAAVAAELAALLEGLAGCDGGDAFLGLQRRAGALPGAHRPIAAVLEHTTRGEATVSGEAVSRAASIAPLLFRLARALQPPLEERRLVDGRALRAAAALAGDGALGAAELAFGAYGSELEAAAAVSADARVLAFVAGAMLEAVRGGEEQADLDVGRLDALLAPAPPPPTFEVLLTPGAARRGRPAGEGWLLALHGPAGATWGRFAHALGAAVGEPLARLDELERAVQPGRVALDVCGCPAEELLDLAAHPPVRAAALALTAWPDGACLAPVELAVVPGGDGAPARLQSGDGPVEPRPLHRLRSTLYPVGLHRLLAGWSLLRQHAPWALAAPDLEELPVTPRLAVDGFVVAPRSFRLPGAAALGKRGALQRFRRESGAPRHVLAGEEDELLPVDLDAPGAARELVALGARRVFEVWPAAPPPGCDRRVEVVAAVVTELPAPATVGVVPDPAAGAARGREYRSLRLHAAPVHVPDLLVEAVLPALHAAEEAGELEGWFFLPFVDEGGAGQLRLRVRGPGTRAFVDRLRPALARAREEALLAAVDETEYFPELGRYGDALDDVHRVFEADSELVAAVLLGGDPELDLTEAAVRSLDGLLVALGLGAAARARVAARLRGATDAVSAVRDELVGMPPPSEGGLVAAVLAARTRGEGAGRSERHDDFRARARRLAAALDGKLADTVEAALVARARRLRGLDLPAALLPDLLHLAAVRLLGVDAEREARVYFLWERALAGVLGRARDSGVE